MFGNCNSLHTNAYDEAITTPTPESLPALRSGSTPVARL